MGDNGLLTLNQICDITGRSYTSVLRYVKSGKLKSITMEIHGKLCYRVNKGELERFLGKSIETMDNHGVPMDNRRITMDNHGVPMDKHGAPLTQETFVKAMEAFFDTKQTQLMKPLEEHALVRYGAISKENEFLKQRLELLVEENRTLQEQIRALPGPITEVTDRLQKQEKEILIFRNKKEELKTRQEELTEKLQKREEQIQTLQQDLQQVREQEARVKAESEEQMKQLSEAWKKELEQARRPWWKFW